MIKRFILTPLLLFCLFLVGCSGGDASGGDSLESYDSGTEATFEGSLQSFGKVNLEMGATHLLNLSNGEVLYVYSEDYDLSDPEYLGSNLEVEGVLYASLTSADKDLFEIESITPVTASYATPDSDSMRGYANDDWGFAMDYPRDWSVIESEYTIVFTSPSLEGAYDQVSLVTEVNTQELAVEEWFLTYFFDENAGYTYKSSLVGPSQIPSIEVSSEGSRIFYIEDGRQVFVVTHDFQNSSESTDYDEIFSEMIYSFDPLSEGLVESHSPSIEAKSIDQYDEVIDFFESQMETLIEGVDAYSIVSYTFVDPHYLYVVYSTEGAEGKVLARLLFSYGDQFQEVARFEEGTTTDWALVSGEDEAKGRPSTYIDVEEGSLFSIPEGYRLLESDVYHLQMAYPGNWYYSRSGNRFFFSNQTANEDNALVYLSILESEETPLTAVETGMNLLTIPSEDGRHYQLVGDDDYAEEMRIMAESVRLD